MKWKKGVPTPEDLPCQLVWDDWKDCQTVVVGETKGVYTWLALFPGFMWYLYETSASSHAVKNRGFAKSERQAKIDASQAAGGELK